MNLRLLPFLLLAAAAAASAQTAPEWAVDPAAARAQRAKNRVESPAAFAPVTDDPALPRVLLIGDSISIGYTPFVRERLRGTANVHRIPDNAGSTLLALVMLDEWLGDEHWDVIHFNIGLHDITRVQGDQPRLPPDVYAANLRRIVRRLQATGARLVFSTSTPVPGRTKNPTRDAADVPPLNERAVAIMKESGIPVNDLNAQVTPRLAELQIPANVHFTEAGSRVMAQSVAEAIRTALSAPAPARPPAP